MSDLRKIEKWLDELAAAVQAVDNILDSADTTLLKLVFGNTAGFLLLPVYAIGKIWLSITKQDEQI